MRKLAMLPVVLICLCISSCIHKELCFDQTNVIYVDVQFDWRHHPEAAPASMNTFLFPIDGSSNPIRHAYVGRDGGRIRVGAKDYMALGFNCDNEDWAIFTGMGDIETFEVQTFDVTRLRATGLDVASMPRARGTVDERVAQTPGMLWNDRLNDINFSNVTTDTTIVFTPREAVSHYTVTVTDVENIKYIQGVQIDATLSGLAEGFYHGSHTPTSNPVTMPFILSVDRERENTLFSGEFLTFGACPESQPKNFISIYLVYSDGAASHFVYDVTDQVRNAPDPSHVDIVVSGLVITKPIVNGGGMHPNVNEWEDVDVHIKM